MVLGSGGREKYNTSSLIIHRIAVVVVVVVVVWSNNLKSQRKRIYTKIY
jgi:hypothetical protein